MEARHRRRDHRLPGREGRHRVRVQQGPLRVRPGRGEGNGNGPHDVRPRARLVTCP
nr:hypothetical protein [Streptomyces olivaceus]